MQPMAPIDDRLGYSIKSQPRFAPNIARDGRRCGDLGDRNAADLIDFADRVPFFVPEPPYPLAIQSPASSVILRQEVPGARAHGDLIAAIDGSIGVQVGAEVGCRGGLTRAAAGLPRVASMIRSLRDPAPVVVMWMRVCIV